MNTRLPRLTPNELNDEQRAVYAAITGGPRGSNSSAFPLTDTDGGLHGPFNAMLLSPPLASPLQELGAAIRYRSILTDRIREMAILTIATHVDCAFERYAHEAVGLDIGLSPQELHALRSSTTPFLPEDPDEHVALELVRALLNRCGVDDALYQAGRKRLGEPALFELATLTGYYSTLAMQLDLFQVGPPTNEVGHQQGSPTSTTDDR